MRHDPPPPVRKFVDHLRHLNGWKGHENALGMTRGEREASDGPRRTSAAIADLRRSMSPQLEMDAAKYIVPYLPDDESVHWAYWMVAGLFGMFPHNYGVMPLARALAQYELRDILQGRPRDLQNPSAVDRRFATLLKRPAHGLKRHLRAMIRQAYRGGYEFSYYELLTDLTRWSHVKRSVQRRWGMQFYGQSK